MSNESKMQGRGTAGGSRQFAQDLVAPLGGIESLIAQLGEARSPVDQEKLIEGLRAAAAHMRSVAAAVAKPGEYAAQSAPVAEAVRFFAVAARARCQSRGRPFRQDISPACEAMIVRDGTRLRQVMEHLLDDVLVRKEVREIVLSAHPARDGGCVVVRVEGRGAGGAAHTAGATRLARDFGGICASDRDGVSVTFPVEHRAAVEEPFAAAADFAPVLLMVDTGSSSQRGLQTVLQSLGYGVEMVGTLDEAMTLMQDRVFAALFADIGLPGSAARAVIEGLRGQGAELPIVALVPPGTQAGPMDANCQAVVEMPCTVHDMRQCLVRIGLRDPMLRQVSAA